MVIGSGQVARETRSLEDWSAVAVSCPGTLELEVDGNRGISIEADDNILPLIETRIDGNTLQIRFKPGVEQVRPTSAIRFRAATPSIEALAVSGSGEIRSRPIEGEELTLDVSGSGSIDLEVAHVHLLRTSISGSGSVHVSGDTTEAEIRISGSGNLQGRDLTIVRASVNMSGSGSALVRVEQTIDGRISGSGSIVYAGKPTISLRTSGSGRATHVPD